MHLKTAVAPGKQRLRGQPHSSGASLPRALRSNEEYDGVRAYRRGDPLKQVVWKKVAKTGQMVSRDGEQALHQMLWLDFDQTAVDGALPALGTEAKLARLCAWAVQADALGLVYGLRLPGQQIAPSGGAPHLRQCLQALALA